MALETATYVDSLNTANPADTDTRSSADDHARLLKASIKRTFPGIAGAVSASHGELNFLQSASVAIQTQLNECKDFAGTVSYAIEAGEAGYVPSVAYATRVNHAASYGSATDIEVWYSSATWGGTSLTSGGVLVENVFKVRASSRYFVSMFLYQNSYKTVGGHTRSYEFVFSGGIRPPFMHWHNRKYGSYWSSPYPKRLQVSASARFAVLFDGPFTPGDWEQYHYEHGFIFETSGSSNVSLKVFRYGGDNTIEGWVRQAFIARRIK